jgi:hypothetical protein
LIERNFVFQQVIRESENPTWTETITVNYHFEQTQQMLLKVYDHDGKYDIDQLDRHQLIGEATFTLSSLMCAPGQTSRCNLTGPHAGKGVVDVRAEPLTNTNDVFVGTFSGQKLANKDGFFGRSDPFIVIARMNEDGTFTDVWKSAKIDNNLNPTFPQSHINISQVCNGDIDRPIKISFMDYDDNGKHQFMGHVQTSIRGLIEAHGTPFNVTEPEKQKTKGYTNSGTLTCAGALVEPHPTFQQFIIGGLEISMIVAIDFTGSNGDPMTPQSLHYLDRSGTGYTNQYQQAIQSVGRIIEEYDTNKMYSVFGFGARVRGPDGQFSIVQHCFPLCAGGAEVRGIDGILKVLHQLYQYCAGINDEMNVYSGVR